MKKVQEKQRDIRMAGSKSMDSNKQSSISSHPMKWSRMLELHLMIANKRRGVSITSKSKLKLEKLAVRLNGIDTNE